MTLKSQMANKHKTMMAVTATKKRHELNLSPTLFSKRVYPMILE
jgi:hypothetical protein